MGAPVLGTRGRVTLHPATCMARIPIRIRAAPRSRLAARWTASQLEQTAPSCHPNRVEIPLARGLGLIVDPASRNDRDLGDLSVRPLPPSLSIAPGSYLPEIPEGGAREAGCERGG